MKNEVCLIEIKKKGLKVVILVCLSVIYYGGGGGGGGAPVPAPPTVTVAHIGIDSLLIKF